MHLRFNLKAERAMFLFGHHHNDRNIVPFFILVCNDICINLVSGNIVWLLLNPITHYSVVV